MIESLNIFKITKLNITSSRFRYNSKIARNSLEIYILKNKFINVVNLENRNRI